MTNEEFKEALGNSSDYFIQHYEGSLDITILEEKLIDVETSAWDGMHVFYNVKYVLKTTTINL